MRETPPFLRCTVCGEPIPADREKRKAATCTPECALTLKSYRRNAPQAKRCRHCGMPSTPEERADFLRWRRDRGHAQEKRGRPRTKETKTNDEALPQREESHDHNPAA